MWSPLFDLGFIARRKSTSRHLRQVRVAIGSGRRDQIALVGQITLAIKNGQRRRRALALRLE